jgi:hypothetical protein
MRVRVANRNEQGELLGHLRRNGCVAFAIDGRAIEAMLLRAGLEDGASIMALVDDWRARRAHESQTYATSRIRNSTA